MKDENKKRAMEMFEMRIDGASYQEIANKYGVTRQYVHQTLSGITTPRAYKYKNVIYKGLRVWMEENGITTLRLHRLISPTASSNNASITSDRLKGKRQFKLSEIILIIKESGLTFEELFMQE